MTYDFHVHTFLSDGENSPIEIIRFAYAEGYECIGITDHASYSNIDEIIKMVTKDCNLARKYWGILAIPGVELTNIPVKSINEMAGYAKDLGAKFVIVHGESIVENVEPQTNWEAVNSKYVDILAHPGMLTPEEAQTAVKNEIYIEITSRTGHCLSNGVVARVGSQAGVRFLLNSDSHNHTNLYKKGSQERVALAAGLTGDQVRQIFDINNKSFIKKIGY
jgi:putative hydrolase